MTDTENEAQNVMVEEIWDVGAIINEKLAPALDGEPITKAIVAMLTFILLLMKPEIQPEEAERIVRATTDFLMDQLNVDGLSDMPQHEKRLVDMN